MIFVQPKTHAECRSVILVTGFEAFDGNDKNGSWEAIRLLQGKQFNKTTVVIGQLPVLWDSAEIKLRELIDENKPAAVISFGQADKGPVRLETTAHNVRKNIPDNRGALPLALKIFPYAPPTLASMLPIQKIKKNLHQAGIPVLVSNNAGSYLCNDVFFYLMYALDSTNGKCIARGFVHVPPLDTKVSTDDGQAVIFDRKLLERTAEIIIRTVVDTL